jgi:hypothetical protein
MTDSELSKKLASIACWEGRVPWPYLDNADPPNVTLGIGCLVASVDEMRELGLHRYSDDQPATPAEAGAEFCRLRSMRGGQRASAYRGGLYLPEPAIDALALARLRTIDSGLPRVFTAYDRLPDAARTCLIDLAWNVGVHGLELWCHLRAALLSDPVAWGDAIKNCSTANPLHSAGRASRNAWRVACMQAADDGRPAPLAL